MSGEGEKLTSPMIERVADAIIEAMGRAVILDETDHTFVDGSIDPAAVARAAIEAMREPTEAMIDASNGALKAFIDGMSPEDRAGYRLHKPTRGPAQLKIAPNKKSRIRFQAMIDAALQGSRP